MRNRLINPPDELLKALFQAPFRPEFFEVNGNKIPYMRLEIPFEMEDPIAWLAAQTLYPKVYWEHPQDGLVAGIGTAVALEHIPQFTSDKGPRFFGGGDFMGRAEGNWEGFPSCSYFLPLIELNKREHGTFFCINKVKPQLEVPMQSSPLYALGVSQAAISRFDSPSYSVWEQRVEEILQGISREEYLKVVLARCTRFEFAEEISPYAILRKLKGESRFAFQFSPEKTFIGSSPETLYRREGKQIESAAVAGTRPRGKTTEEDRRWMEELLASPKELYEFDVVKEMILNALSPLCTELKERDRKVLKTPTVQHLYHTFSGKLQEVVTDETLIKALHPTPAVGGYPREKALGEIAKRENFDRGWYAAPIGWVAPHSAHHLVAIRSALIEKRALHLFAGTGIVNGSAPIREWDELEQKISQFTSML